MAAFVARWTYGVSIVTGLIGCLAWCAGPVYGDSKAERRQRAKDLVAEALTREIYGMLGERQSLLEDAAREAPDVAEAQWQLGRVWFRNRWTPAADVPELLAGDARWAEYHRRRQAMPDTVQAHWALANWCRSEKLLDQERAHLMRVVQIDPDHAAARQRLGFRRVDGVWVSAEQQARDAAAIRENLASLERWWPRLEPLRKMLDQRSLAQREHAAESLRALADPSAIPALEQLLSDRSPAAASILVQTLHQMADPRASAALARLAVLSAWSDVRSAAARALRDQDRDSYVPLLLAEMYSPVASRVDVVPGRQLLLRQTFVREGQDHEQQLVLDTRYERIARPGGDRRDTFRRAFDDAQRRVLASQQMAADQNALTAQYNARIAQTLNLATDQQLDAKPSTWWQWWHAVNEVYVSGSKPVRTIQATQQVAVSDRDSSLFGPGGSLSGGGGTQGAYDCMAAGTQVWTADGPRDIQTVQVGDLVLAQDAASGELAYKPVLETTIRPRGQVLRVTLGQETIVTSGGHLFWVSGDGWVKARQLRSGMLVHTPGGAVPVGDVASGSGELLTYNLVVADFHAYFVGDERLLCHDNTVRRPTRAAVPGL